MVKDLTVGKPEEVLWKFSIPMFVSVIFQQMYNIADSVIAGKFAGEDALAAVGASYPITMIFMDTTPGCGDPTRAGGRCTSRGCSPSTSCNSSRSVPAQSEPRRF